MHAIRNIHQALDQRILGGEEATVTEVMASYEQTGLVGALTAAVLAGASSSTGGECLADGHCVRCQDHYGRTVRRQGHLRWLAASLLK